MLTEYTGTGPGSECGGAMGGLSVNIRIAVLRTEYPR
jgi:hypothetical protein